MSKNTQAVALKAGRRARGRPGGEPSVFRGPFVIDHVPGDLVPEGVVTDGGRVDPRNSTAEPVGLGQYVIGVPLLVGVIGQPLGEGGNGIGVQAERGVREANFVSCNCRILRFSPSRQTG